MNELEILAISLCKGYVGPLLNYLEDCGAKNMDDIKILLKAPILYCVSEFNDGYSRDNVQELNKTILTIKSKML